VSTIAAIHGFEPPFRPVAAVSADISHLFLDLAASNDAGLPRAGPVERAPCPTQRDQPYFEIYRADEVRLTSILFSGGDWRWRFCSGAGVPIATSVGYANERDCAAAVAALRCDAGDAPVLNERRG